ncbi:glucose-1-phosphate cytidylyltransferase [Candidatus Pacearchaeota archaeon]|nr:glucose-1-phosphate cytidylyltransferase [Candidatus Pacearchaeota archaeon]
MKVVLFCGGLGLRIREHSGNVPKPMVNIGNRPILWHVMRYYAHFGHKDFILCLGYQAEAIKQYFLNYDECISNDFTLSDGGKELNLASRDIDDWTITFVDTGMKSNIGQRLKAVEPYLKDEEVFLANYSDNVTDFHLPDLIVTFLSQDKVAGFLCVRPSYSFHVVGVDGDGSVSTIESATEADIWLNGGCFVLRNAIFDYMRDGDELVEEPFQRLIRDNKLMAYKYDGFWMAMDTFKEKQRLEDLSVQGNPAWKVW